MPADLRRRLGTSALAVILGGGLAGCGGSGSHSTTTSSTALSTPGVVLGADGLGVVHTGDAQASAAQTMVHHIGPITTETPGPCPGTTEIEWSDLSLEFSRGVLDGYRYLEGGLSSAGELHPPTGPGSPVLTTATGATLGMTLAEVRPLYPAGDFTMEQGGSIVVPGSKAGDRLFLGFFSSASSTPLTEIKGGSTCGNV